MKRTIINTCGWSLGLALLTSACNVDENEPETQGVKLGDESDAEESDESDGEGTENSDAEESDNDQADNAQDAGASSSSEADAAATAERETDEDGTAVEAPEVRGFYAVHTDYMGSATVSAVGVDGEVLSETLIASGQAPAGLSFDIGSDIVVPSGVNTGDQVVLVDRATNVIHWVGLKSAEVEQQLNVGPGGFAANPYDYVLYADDKAFVTRYESNADPGNEDFDEGGDVLVIDPSEGEITGRIDLADTVEEGVLPRPDSALLAQGALFVTAAAIDADFAVYGESQLVTIDPEEDEVVDVLAIEDMRNCGELALAPGGELLAVGCAGEWSDPLATSGVALVDISGDAPKLVEQYFAADLNELQLSTLSFISDETILFTAFGDFVAETGDAVWSLDLDSGEVADKPIHQNASAYTIGSLFCAVGEGACLFADADEGAGLLRLIQLEDGEVDDIVAIEIDDGIGMPPRYIGAF